MTTEIIHGDCIEQMRNMPDNSVDSIVTDPPYGLGFMGKKWDALPPGEEWATECLRVLKPGGHLLSFGGTRTWHRLAVAVEDAGFEIRDSIAWMYGSGFPKSLDVSKAIDKAAGAEREVVGARKVSASDLGQSSGWNALDTSSGNYNYTAPATESVQQRQGWGTALKPAFEPVVVARKPLVGTVAGNVQTWGTGALNINATRIGTTEPLTGGRYANLPDLPDGAAYGAGINKRSKGEFTQPSGRWPANVVLDETTAELLDQQSGISKSTIDRNLQSEGTSTWFTGGEHQRTSRGDSGGASRFFKVAKSDELGAISEHFPREFDAPFMYVAKAPKKERPVVDGVAHPTVKPLALMRWLVKLVTPPGGTVLEPFAGSGATVEACMLEGFNVIAIEQEAEYLPLIQARIDRAA